MAVYVVARVVLDFFRSILYTPHDDLDPAICMRKLYNLCIKTLELVNVFGVITLCIGNLIIIKAQNCYSEAPLSSYLSLSLVLITDLCILFPFIKKIFIICYSGKKSSI